MVDVLLAVLLLAALIAGIRQGFFTSIGWLAGLFAGGVAAIWVIPLVTRLVPDATWHSLVAIVTTVLLLALGAAIGGAIGKLVRRGADKLKLKLFERVLGGAVGVVAAALALTLAGTGLASAGIPVVSSAVSSSQILGTIQRLTPAPVASALAQLRSVVIDDTLPGLESLLGGTDTTVPTDVDTDDEALAAAAESVARVTGTAYSCGTTSSGSGFVVAEDRVVTNAHVVAGIDRPVVELPGEAARDGRVVYFDPVDDIAVIAVDVDADPLPLDQLTVGDDAVIQGYPHGGPFQTTAARVSAEGAANVPDIYGGSSSEREIYSLAAEVVPGNSGGPLLTLDGAVAGMVFARDTNQSQVGYAMTTAELLPVIATLDSATSTVSTGSCTS